MTWSQYGSDLNITVTGGAKYAGKAVAISSDGAYIAFADSYSTSDMGRVKIFKNTNNSWTQIGQDITGEWGDSLGSSLSFSSNGQIIAIGAKSLDEVGAGTNEGGVRVYRLNNDSWDQVGKYIQGKWESSNAGYSVSLSSDGNVLAMGVPFSYGLGSNSVNIGAVRLYKNNNDSWEQIGSDIYGDNSFLLFGSSVSLSSDGSKVAVSNRNSDVRVFQNTNDNWSQIGSEIEGIRGYSNAYSTIPHSNVKISSDGTRLVIGGDSTPWDQFSTNTGSVRVFDFNGDWSQVGETLNGESEGDFFGYSVDISNDGSIIAIGAYGVGSIGDDSIGEGKGSIYVYEESNNNWTQLGDAINGEFDGDQEGYSVNLSGDGSLLISGANYNDDGGLLSGQVRVFFNPNLTESKVLNYIASYGDLINAFGTDTEAAKSHYINHGYAEGRSLTLFSAADYLNNYVDLSAAFGDDQTAALKHFIEYGFSEGRTDSYTGSGSSGSSDLTDLEAYNYIASHTDLISAFGTDIEAAKSHYADYGKSEGRTLDNFDELSYIAGYGDLINAFGSDTSAATQHFINHGYTEGRSADNFDKWSYLASYGDLIAAFGSDTSAATQHFINHGYAEGRSKDSFDEWGYLASNNDLINAFGIDTTKAVKHYISYGKSEGRSTNLFNAQSYLNNYADLRNTFGDSKELATKHYVEYGFNEGRVF